MSQCVSIVVPVYNNARSLSDVVSRFQRIAEAQPESFEFIFVDDGSRDDSFRVLERLAAEEPRVRAVKLSRNFGSNAASSAGISLARGDAVIATSADLQDPPELIPQMLAKWREGYKVVLAARSDRRDPWPTMVTSNLFWRLFRRFAIPAMPRQGSDYCLIDRQVIRALADTHEPSAGIAMVLWTGFEPAIIPYERRERDPRYGRSGWTWSKKITYLIDSFVSFSHMPIRCASLLGIATGAAGVLGAILLIVRLVLYGPPPTNDPTRGWASTIVVSLIVGGIQLLMMGILGEYMVRTLESTRRRPPFIVERIVGGGSPAPGQLQPQTTEQRP